MGASDKAIAAILKWAGREEWRERLDTVIAAHLGPACEAAGVAPDELGDLLGDDAHAQLIGCALEDFLTCDFEPDSHNIVDDYLKRRGWKEPVAVKQYLQALRRSTMSLYEVVDTTPGSHFVVRDLVRGGEPVQVVDKRGSQSLARWDRLAARLLSIGGKTQMSGGALLLDFDAAAALVEEISGLKKDLTRTIGRQAKREGMAQGMVATLPVAEAVLGEAAPLITQAWLVTTLERAQDRSPPKLANFDGEDLVFCETRFPLVDPDRVKEEVAACLDRLPHSYREEPAEPAWTWLAAETAARGKARNAAARDSLTFTTFDAGGGRVLGSLRLEENAVVLTTNSVARAERGQTMLREALGQLVGTPLTSMQMAEQMLAARQADGCGNVNDEVEEPPLPPEEAEAAMREVLDQHYRGVLGQPLPMLDGQSPKQAARSKTGRQKVAQWLKYLENQTAHRAGGGHMPAYDFGWMWEELKLADPLMAMGSRAVQSSRPRDRSQGLDGQTPTTFVPAKARP